MNDQELASFLEAFDSLCVVAMTQGATGAELAGAVLARVSHLYLSDNTSDLEGLERLLTVPLDTIKNRPRWDIE